MTAALEGGEWSATRLGRTLPPGKTRYPFYRRLGKPQGRSRRAENLVCTGIRSRTVQSVASRYTDWATGPTVIELVTYYFRTKNMFPLLRDLNLRSCTKRHDWPVCGPPTSLTGPSSTVRSSQISDTEQTLYIIPTVLQTTLCDACGSAFVQSITRGVVTAKCTPSLDIGTLALLANHPVDMPLLEWRRQGASILRLWKEVSIIYPWALLMHICRLKVNTLLLFSTFNFPWVFYEFEASAVDSVFK